MSALNFLVLQFLIFLPKHVHCLMNSFPQEIIDSIIDEIPRTEPFTNLKSCSLVAKAFRRQAQGNFFPYSFCAITLPIRARSPDLSSELKRCEAFYELIQGNPDIAKHVRHVTFKDVDLFDAIEAHERHRVEFMDKTRHLVDHTLHLVLNKLVKLETLELHFFDLSRISTKFVAALLARPVTHLILDDVFIHHIEDLLTLIRTSPELRSLALGKITLLDYEYQRRNLPYETERLTLSYSELASSRGPCSPAEVETVIFELSEASVLRSMEALSRPESPISFDRIENFEVYSKAAYENTPGSVNDALAEISIWLGSFPRLRKCVLPLLIPRDHQNRPDALGPALHIKHVESLRVVFNLNSTEDIIASLDWWTNNFEMACGQDCMIQEIVLEFSIMAEDWDISEIDFVEGNWWYLDDLFVDNDKGPKMPLLRNVSIDFRSDGGFEIRTRQRVGFYNRMAHIQMLAISSQSGTAPKRDVVTFDLIPYLLAYIECMDRVCVRHILGCQVQFSGFTGFVAAFPQSARA
ncbi:uncharacterized protein BT62DRAFT_1077489 [Guyanagaster necrorhizus]|uniref:F-box domain-containing protein n=1 Tax=Guyanagaster necrorhizus TaxID=856835 RepID=A0A9P8ARB4_9AGAR|nr:uncharacterized protein BT62DRAFT_1077489 [Guyanagaster necrorhizus MCA 3950]KAG7444711.1 hypothetical protein BT62DRAFT_1077489 [Guyanagaster necrorhizus MCA 3950]